MIKFGTGGFRAIIGDEFTKDNVQQLARAVARKMKAEEVKENTIVLGYDRRFLSREASQWAAEVFAQEGIKVLLIDKPVPTPMIMFEVKRLNLDYGMAVTASHNPALYNGVKLFIKGGRDADEIATKDVEKYIAALEGEEIKSIDFEDAIEKQLVEIHNPFNEYIDEILSQVDVEKIREAGLKIALDPMYGVSQTSLRTILMTARCELDVINERHDTLFGGKLPTPNAANLRALQNYVIDGQYDMGIATDGDADRLGVIDNNGRFLHPNDILVLLYYYLVKYKGWHGPVVRNIATTHLLDRVAKSFGEECYEVPVGFKHISSKMLETDAIIGGESSGGLTVKGHIQGKDGVYAASLLTEMIAVTGKSLAKIYKDICNEYGSLYMTENDYSVTQKRKEALLKAIMVDKKTIDFPYEIKKVSYLDGYKVYFKNGGWVIIRFSGTEPVLRVFAEMDTEEKAQEISSIVEKALNLV
ncbi:MAG: phosphoglucomutase/phosphomannomutase family protein [Clostridium sp.]